MTDQAYEFDRYAFPVRKNHGRELKAEGIRVTAESLDAAMLKAARLSTPGDVLVLSAPRTASLPEDVRGLVERLRGDLELLRMAVEAGDPKHELLFRIKDMSAALAKAADTAAKS